MGTLMVYPTTSQTNGTNASIGNTGMASVSATTGGAITFDSAFGKLKYVEPSSGSAQTVAGLIGTYSGTVMSARIPVYIQATPSATLTICLARHTNLTTGGGSVGRVQITTAGALQYNDSTAGTISLGTLSFGHWYEICVRYEGGSATASKVKVTVYDTDGTTVVLNPAQITNANLTTNNIVGLTMGGSNVSATFGMGVIQLEDARTTDIPKYVSSNNPPTVAAPVDVTKAPLDVVSLVATGSDVEGPLSPIQWTWLYTPPGVSAPGFSGSGAALSTSVTIPAGGYGLYTARITVTDTDSVTASDDVNIFVPTNDVSVIAVQSNGGPWTNVGGAADLIAAFRDALTTTYGLSPDSPSSEAILKLRLAPMSPVSALSIDLTEFLTGTGALVTRLRVMEGGTSTVRKTFLTTPPTGGSGSMATNTYTLSGAETATITGWNTLDIEISAALT